MIYQELPIAAARLSQNLPEVETEALLNFINVTMENQTLAPALLNI